MKTLLCTLALVISAPVFAQSVFVNPIIFNFGNMVQVQINNNTDSNINCSGPVQMNSQFGRMETNYFSEYIRKNSFALRSFYLMSPNDRVTFSNHFINCSKAF